MTLLLVRRRGPAQLPYVPSNLDGVDQAGPGLVRWPGCLAGRHLPGLHCARRKPPLEQAATKIGNRKRTDLAETTAPPSQSLSILPHCTYLSMDCTFPR